MNRSLNARLDALEKKLQAAKGPELSPGMIAAYELSALCTMPKSDEATEANARSRAEHIVAALMADEDPVTPHYPLAIVSALSDRYGIELVKYAVNEKHAEILRNWMSPC
jgi:hypothetical protein